MTNFERDAAALRGYVAFLRDNKKTFWIKHGTYTTTIETPHGKTKYQTTNFSDRVFIAAKMIKKDAMGTAKGREICETEHNKVNFGSADNLKPFTADRVLNIDISSAYATCLLVSGLITQRTFDYLKTLKKEERLPAVGMLARSNCTWKYTHGVCDDIVVYREPTAELFFYIIEEINYVMRSLQWELGQNFYFYWVDGVFFDWNTPKGLVSRCERILSESGYPYKYELVENFVLKKDTREVFTIEMIKNSEFKRYQFSKKNDSKEVRKYLIELAEGSQNKITL
jgi:hypothetical protein